MWHTIIKMAFIKEETEDVSISETFIVKNEDAEDDTGWFISYWFICLLKKINNEWYIFLKKYAAII